MSTDQADSKPTLRFPAGRFEGHIAGVIVLVQAITALMTALVFLFWVNLVLGSLYSDVDWYPGVLGLAIALAILVVLLHWLYEFE